MSKDFETRRIAVMETSNKQGILNTLAEMGFQNVHGYTCSSVETLTGREVMKYFVAEATGPRQLLDIMCELWGLSEIHTLDGSYWM